MDPDLILGTYKMDGELVGDRGSSTLARIGTPTLGRLPDLVPALTVVPGELVEKLHYPTPCSQDKAKRDSPSLFRPYDLIVCIETGAFRI